MWSLSRRLLRQPYGYLGLYLLLVLGKNRVSIFPATVIIFFCQLGYMLWCIFGASGWLKSFACICFQEKYGPKGQGKASNGPTPKPNKDSKPKADVDINVGLSDRPPWFCRYIFIFLALWAWFYNHQIGKMVWKRKCHCHWDFPHLNIKEKKRKKICSTSWT